MKKKVAILICSIIWATIMAFGQSDVAAKRILDQVSKKYDAYNTIQSAFSFSIAQVEGETNTDKGKLYLNKSKSQYSIHLSNQDLLSDGNSNWSILHDEKEVQVTPVDDNATSIGPNNLFTFYKIGYKYKLVGDERENGGLLRVIELSPIDTKTNYSKIKLRINEKNHIHDVLIFDKSGAKYTYTIKSLYVNHQIPALTFKFDKAKYPSYEVVDLR